MLGSHGPTSTASIRVVRSSTSRSTIWASNRASGPIETELIRCVELGRIAVRRAPQQQQAGTGRQVRTGEGGIGDNVPIVAAERRFVPQHLLDERPEQVRVFAQLPLNVGQRRHDPH
jgi:hypothetical protein